MSNDYKVLQLVDVCVEGGGVLEMCSGVASAVPERPDQVSRITHGATLTSVD